MFEKTMDTETIRESFRPETIRLLLVGESPPSGGTFFYIESDMTKHTATAFKKAHGPKCPDQDQAQFLEYFKACGGYLDDICHFPIDKLDRRKREEALVQGVPELASRLELYRPEAIAVVLKKIELHVRIAIAQANIGAKLYVLPFPGHGHQAKYINAMAQIAKEHAGWAKDRAGVSSGEKNAHMMSN